MSSFPDAVQKWMDNRDGGEFFPDRKRCIAEHDPECSSLEWAWLPRKNGRVAQDDISRCDGDCEVTFFNEGVGHQIDRCEECWFCACCASRITVCPCEEESMMRFILGRF